jgi:hypothetical protein
MDELGDHTPRNSALADLGPLPDVVISNSETTWNMFVELQSRQSSGFVKTQPSGLGPFIEDFPSAGRTQTVDDVMLEARRHNRVCPRELPWQQLHAILREASPDAPPPLVGAEYRRTAPLAKRLRVREQVEWAAHRGLVGEVFAFLSVLPEAEWVHMGE